MVDADTVDYLPLKVFVVEVHALVDKGNGDILAEIAGIPRGAHVQGVVGGFVSEGAGRCCDTNQNHGRGDQTA